MAEQLRCVSQRYRGWPAGVWARQRLIAFSAAGGGVANQIAVLGATDSGGDADPGCPSLQLRTAHVSCTWIRGETCYCRRGLKQSLVTFSDDIRAPVVYQRGPNRHWHTELGSVKEIGIILQAREIEWELVETALFFFLVTSRDPGFLPKAAIISIP
ncbi:hypothetical protein LZ31DRAFT_345172 [Colletotrichum somersetense]|nr:hypothetical protein LZ31DRAFT_345172 [Colletotrichum somersetense]